MDQFEFVANKEQMWKDLGRDSNERYKETLRQTAERSGVPFEDVAWVLECYQEVAARRSREMVAARRARDLEDE
jgi:hypothetical protein